MKLSGAANAFNRALCRDAYTSVPLFRCQLGLYDDNKRDSETAERRVISLSPSAVIPARRVINVLGLRVIIGHANPDIFGNSPVRVGYVAQEANHLARIRSLSQVCLDQEGTHAYAGSAWVKNAAFTEQGSHLAPQFHIHFAQGEPVTENCVVTLGGHQHVVRAVNNGAGGTLVALCEEMPEPSVEAAGIKVGAFNSVTSTFVGTIVHGRVVRLRWQSMFKYGSNMSPAFGPDDIQVAIAKSVADVSPGTRLTLSDGVWHVASADGVGDVWLCRATKHG